MIMQWSGYEQLKLFIASILLGCCLGLLFSLFNVASKLRHYRWIMFLSDAMFFAVASIISFFFALAMMDGLLHPLLFCGCLVGFVVFHAALGRYLSRWLYRLGRWLIIVATKAIRWTFMPFKRLLSALRHAFNSNNDKRTKKAGNSRKKSIFFQKNS